MLRLTLARAALHPLPYPPQIKGVTRCEAKKDGGIGPVYDADLLDGLWLVLPNGTHAWAYDYIGGLLSDPQV